MIYIQKWRSTTVPVLFGEVRWRGRLRRNVCNLCLRYGENGSVLHPPYATHAKRCPPVILAVFSSSSSEVIQPINAISWFQRACIGLSAFAKRFPVPDILRM